MAKHSPVKRAPRTKAEGCDVLLVGYESQENLGLRSLAAFLSANGVRAKIQPCHNVSHEEVLARIQQERPKLVGFSLIFQRMLPDFSALIGDLRAGGVQAHFTIGGHFPTFEYRHLLKTIPGLDTVVRCEGEQTLLELYRRLDQRETWGQVRGIAFRRNGRVVATAPRPLIADLDSLPHPVRSQTGTTHRGLGICSLAGSRGCYYNCTFCSIQEFYREASGPKRRARSPAHVADEMQALYDRPGPDVRIFIFQDDDLFMKGRHHRGWVEAFLCELERRGMAGRILWRISCRIDDLDPDLLLPMKAAGLVSVYLGIESGCEQGLKTFNKHYGVADVYRAVEMLNRIDLPFEFGFMLLDPDSTLSSVRENIDFLRAIVAGGKALVNFCKMAPYAGTPIAARLKAEGRLQGTADSPDYQFLDPRLDLFQLFVSQTFNFRNFSDHGLVERLRFAKFDCAVLEKFFADGYNVPAYAEAIRSLIQASNDSALETLGLAASLMDRCSEAQVLDYWPLIERWRQAELSTQLQVTAALDQLQARYDLIPSPAV